MERVRENRHVNPQPTTKGKNDHDSARKFQKLAIKGKEGAMISLNVNGKVHSLDVPGDTPLLWALRDHLDLKGTKVRFGIGECGTCQVHIRRRGSAIVHG